MLRTHDSIVIAYKGNIIAPIQGAGDLKSIKIGANDAWHLSNVCHESLDIDGIGDIVECRSIYTVSTTDLKNILFGMRDVYHALQKCTLHSFVTIGVLHDESRVRRLAKAAL